MWMQTESVQMNKCSCILDSLLLVGPVCNSGVEHILYLNCQCALCIALLMLNEFFCEM
jgi:hypothetical protein